MPDQKATPAPSQKDLENYFQDIPKPQPEEIVYQWRAPTRPFKKRSRQHYSTIIIIIFLISLILFFAGQFLPIAAILAMAFLYYVLSTVEPGLVRNQITTYGIRQEEQLYYWEELGRFWFEKKHNQELVNIELARFPNRLVLLLGKVDKKDLEQILSEVLIQERPKLTSFEKAAKWLQEKVPLE